MGHGLVCCVLPDADEQRTVTALLTSELDVSVVSCSSIADAIETLDHRAVDCLVTAFELPDGTGTELTARLRELSPDTGCVLYTDADRERVTDAAGSAYLAQHVDSSRSRAGDRLVQLVDAAMRFRTNTAYPRHEDESDRIAELDRFAFDDPSLHAALRRVTELGAVYFDVPQTSINVVGENSLEYLACTGAEGAAIPRERSICTYTVLGEGVTVIENVQTDPRFRENGIVREMGIRWYAGCPLRTRSGNPIGTVCVYDEEHRSFSDTDERFLRLLADEAMAWIETLGTEGDRPAARALPEGYQ